MMTNFHKYASPLIKNPSWDPGNKYTMAWQSGWTAIGYNSSVIKNPGTSVDILFDKKYAGQGRHDVRPAGTRQRRAAGASGSTRPRPPSPTGRRRPRSCSSRRATGIVRAYYDQSYIDHLKNGDTVVSQAWSGDIFQADLNSKYRDLKLLDPAARAACSGPTTCASRCTRRTPRTP